MSFNLWNCSHKKAFTIEKIKGLTIACCYQCKLLFTAELYRNITKPEYNPSGKSFREYERYYAPHRIITYKKHLPTLLKYRKTNKLLDLGCGYGHFLSLAKTEGWQVEGVESSDYDSQIAKRQNNVVIHRDLNNTKLTRESFDVVTLWDTIEHILDINTVIKKIRGLLRPGGAILIKTPDARIFNYKKKLFPEIFIHFYRSYIYPSNPRQHIYHFNPEYLIDLLKNYGFDSFRVEEDELFSERIISGNNIFVRLVRLAFMQITWHMNLPFEFVLICEKKT